MNQIGENKDLRADNRRLRQQVQIFKNQMSTVESTMDRIKTFTTRLRVITNTQDQGSLLQSMSNDIPDSNASLQAAALAEKKAAEEAEPQDPETLQLQQDYQKLQGHFIELTKDTLSLEQLLQDQYERLADQKAFLAALPTRKPVVGYYTSGFGIRRSPYGGAIKMHEGVDIANRPGTIVHAPADGIVEFAGVKPGYGETVVLDHGYGLETLYGHNRKLLVKKGQKIRRGDDLSLLGNTGRSTGPHLHYEVRVHGFPVDPLSYILEN